MFRLARSLRRTLGAALGAALLASGCISHEGPLPAVRVRDERAPYARIRMNSVSVTETLDGKRSALAVEQNDARRTETGTLEVFATLRNRGRVPVQIEARTHFFDQTQRLVEPSSAWQRIFLPPNGIGQYHEFSTHIHDVALYYVEVREVR